jgi:hypothetical protein
MHAIAETQMENRDPIEVYQFYNAMRKKKASHHEAVHVICAVLVPLIFKTLKEKEVFDLEEYRSQLKSYKHMKPWTGTLFLNELTLWTRDIMMCKFGGVVEGRHLFLLSKKSKATDRRGRVT